VKDDHCTRDRETCGNNNNNEKKLTLLKRAGGQSLSGQTLSIAIVKVLTPLAKYVSWSRIGKLSTAAGTGAFDHIPITDYRLPAFS